MVKRGAGSFIKERVLDVVSTLLQGFIVLYPLTGILKDICRHACVGMKWRVSAQLIKQEFSKWGPSNTNPGV